MELIKVEDLKRWRANRIQGGQCNHDDMEALGAFIDQVEKEERKQGTWRRYYNHCICSECDGWVISHIGSKPYPYCPNCGAKMEGGE